MYVIMESALLWRSGLLRPFADARLPRTTAVEKGTENERKIPENYCNQIRKQGETSMEKSRIRPVPPGKRKNELFKAEGSPSDA